MRARDRASPISAPVERVTHHVLGVEGVGLDQDFCPPFEGVAIVIGIVKFDARPAPDDTNRLRLVKCHFKALRRQRVASVVCTGIPYFLRRPSAMDVAAFRPVVIVVEPARENPAELLHARQLLSVIVVIIRG